MDKIKLYAVILSFFILLFAAGNVFATNYYIDAVNGNDNNSGLSPSKAWKSINVVSNKSFNPGDVVSLAAGQSFDGCNIYLRSVSNRHKLDGVTFNSFGSGPRPIIKSVTWTAGIFIDNQNNVHFYGLEFTRDSTAENGFLAFDYCPGLIIDSCVFNGQGKNTRDMLWIGYNTDTSIVRNCLFENGGTGDASRYGYVHGFYGSGNYIIVENSRFINNPYGNGLKSNVNLIGGVDSYCSHWTIRDNYFEGNITGAFFQSLDSSAIYDNVFVNTLKYSNAIAFSQESGLGFMPRNVKVFNNTIVLAKNLSNVGIYLYGYADIDSITIKNNIIYSQGGSGEHYAIYQQPGGGQNIFINNNLYYSPDGQNGFWSLRGTSYNSFSSWQAAGYDGNSKWGNPDFTSLTNRDFTLSQNSPALYGAADVGISSDYAGNPVPAFRGDIGALQHSFLQANIKVFLEGTVNNGKMTTNLSSQNLIPLSQPYDSAPWNFTDNETVSKIPSGIVDWILVELRSNTSGSSVVARKAGFLKSDGEIVDLDGVSPLRFDFINSGNYYIVVKHRNHLAVMSSVPVQFQSTSVSGYDFTNSQLKAYGTNPMFDYGNGTYAMYSGDGDGNGGISSIDRNSIWRVENGQIGYLPGDYDLSGGANSTDLNDCWRKNNGTLTQVPQ